MAVIAKSTGNDLWRQMRDGITVDADRFNFELQWSAPESEADYTQQADMVDDAVSRHVDGILLSPTHQTVLASAVRRAQEAGIAVVIVDAPIALRPDQYTAYVGSSDVEIGSLAAERAFQVLHGHGRCAILGVSPTLEGSTLRERSFRERLHQLSPALSVNATAYGVSDWARSHEAARDLLERHPDTDLMFASDPFGTLGAYTALHARKQPPLLIGVDNEGARLDLLERGEIDSLVLKDMRRIGKEAVDVLEQALQRQSHRSVIEVPVRLRTRPDAHAENNPRTQPGHEDDAKR